MFEWIEELLDEKPDDSRRDYAHSLLETSTKSVEQRQRIESMIESNDLTGQELEFIIYRLHQSQIEPTHGYIGAMSQIHEKLKRMGL